MPVRDGHAVPSAAARAYTHGVAVSSEARTGITLAANGSAIDITVAAGLSADAHWSTAAVLWFRSATPAGLPAGAATLRELALGFASLPADSSNIQIGVAWADAADRTSNYSVAGADFAAAGRRTFAARHLSGTTTPTIDTDGAGAFGAFVVQPGINVGGGTILSGTTTIVGVVALDDLDTGSSPFDTVSHSGSLAGATHIGLCVRAVGVTTATTAQVMLYGQSIPRVYE